MSQLDETQVEALNKHIGIRGEEEKKEEEEKKPQILVPASEKRIKTGPRIIRKTQINLDEKEDKKSKAENDAKNPSRVTVMKENSGLMPGLIRPKAPTRKQSHLAKERPHEKMDEKQGGANRTSEITQESTKKNSNFPSNDHKTEPSNNHKSHETTAKRTDTHPKEEIRTKQTTDNFRGNRVPNNVANKPSGNHRSQGGHFQHANKDRVNRSNNVQRNTTASQSHQMRGDGKGFSSKGQQNRTSHGENNTRAKSPLNIKNEMIPTAQKPESKRDYQSKVGGRETQKETRKDGKRDSTRPTVQNSAKKINKNALMGEKKGVSEALSEDFILKEFYNDDNKRKRGPRNKYKMKDPEVIQKQTVSLIKISGDVTVKDLAEALKKTSTEVIKKLMNLGIMATVNQEIDFDTATLLADEFGVKVEKELLVSEEDILFDDTDDQEENLETRPPVVVVMGHVDHGKTSLLDTLRKSNVMDKEAGGITQHIGAYMVTVNERKITFLDTPGHEAFTAMRARGARVTDIAILVVAADDGVMPQTIEAINHAKAAGVNMIVAINKIDKPGANPERVKQELTEHEVLVEEWGGDIICVPVSAKEGTNIDQLLEMVLLSADVLELKANPKRQAKGTVIEAKLDKDRGPVATVLVQRGTLKHGDSVVSGTSVGRIRAMIDDRGHSIQQALPSTPVEILGLPEVLEAGEIFYAIDDEKVAKQLAGKRRVKLREQTIKSTTKITLDDLFNQIKEGKVKELNLIVKADVQGSVEAVRQSLQKLTNDEVRVNIIHGGVGTITESDVTFADVSNAIIIGFNVRPSANVMALADEAGVDLRLYQVIYKAIEDIEAAMKGMLDPTYQEVVLGHIEVRQIFKASGIGVIGGGYVIDGKILRGTQIRLLRDGVIVHDGKLSSLKRFKDDAKEVAQGYECGFTIEKFNDIKVNDVIECYQMEEVKR